MKNMKKTILGVAILAMVLIVMIGSVNAASVTANNKEVKKGEMVTVSVNTGKPVMAIEFELKYDAEKFEYVGASAGSLGTPSVTVNNGVATVAIAASDGKSTTSSVTLNFKAKETTEGKSFTVSNLITDVTSETITNATTTVKIVEDTTEKPEEPTTPSNPDTTEKPEEPTTPSNPDTPSTEEKQETTTINSQKANEKVGTNGEVIKKLPQTGTPVFIGAVALIAIAGVVLVVRKTK